jgi:hypothetical protein
VPDPFWTLVLQQPANASANDSSRIAKPSSRSSWVATLTS